MSGRPWLPALFSFAVPGLGQLYNGRPTRAAGFFLIMPVLQLTALPLMWTLPRPPFNVLAPLLLNLSVSLFAVGEAAFDARLQSDPPVRPVYRRWYVCLILVMVVQCLFLPIWVLCLRDAWVQSFKIPTPSMEAAILAGDHFLVDKTAYGLRLPLSHRLVMGGRAIRRGDIVSFLLPVDRQRVFTDRVVGLPGETVEIRDKRVLIDGRVLWEPYARREDKESEAARDNWGPAVVPAHDLFVLGDNRDHSRDSRFWGFVHADDVLGMARLVYWSQDPRSGAVRWERIGHALQ